LDATGRLLPIIAAAGNAYGRHAARLSLQAAWSLWTFRRLRRRCPVACLARSRFLSELATPASLPGYTADKAKATRTCALRESFIGEAC